MDAEILPEPSGDEREAFLAALAEVDGFLEPPPAYRSPWRVAGLPVDEEDEL